MKYRRFFITLLVVVLALTGFGAGAYGTRTGQASPADVVNPQPGARASAGQATKIYLPHFLGGVTQVTGTIDDNGKKIGVQPIKVMRSTNGGASYQQTGQITSNTEGKFVFLVPMMRANDRYQLLWDNPTENSDWLNYFICNPVLPSDKSKTCNINVRDVRMVSPVPGASVFWPITFQWTMRSTTTDSYQVRLFEDQDAAPWTTPFRGYVDRVTMPSAPPGTSTNKTYLWSMYVRTPSGDGDAFYFRTISWQDLNGPALSEGVLEAWQASVLETVPPDLPKVIEEP